MRGRWTGRLAVFVGVLLAVAVVALGAVGGSMYWNRVETHAEQQTRDALPDLAKDQIPAILGFDYQTIRASSIQAYQLMTPEFRKQYEDESNKTIIPQALDRQVISQVNVVGVGMLTAQRNSGSVLVFMNRTLTDKSKQPLYDGSRLQVDYQKIDGRWLINAINLV
ncbi:hypothetical protein MMAG44476_13406 [Mycolicibacterium mageritense DSM 44476 = CIP 104973]|uniref:Mammalian cell entry protein n=1 Tax=Mycolicibacterium mageritense TaxID=53462 RepID=A0AAI8XLU6_MYCME|nr:hypothetical protein [Mycolicibacterium mageritense]MBN3456126.1 mammalian cell entry protein [Mycobacterium sp. DSM 3803]OKH77935.1 mammalian cell entry protein [Mycobacterium sp. SWH-M3]MCC9181872.1 mammalian cell entry protein [Mycolicibacterium mageritense]TXI63240.1 MAG: mammalian cell entry protein [Mycolicibacterium mageritense]CDO21232.1 Macrophage killing protein with similarity to conjugation protein [Mycolicibacterium mageritense DSM 44476 = CIP 104973]